jgi:hypothetical protein
MPRVTPVRRATVVEKRARALCAKLARVSDDTPMEYRMVRLMARVLALDYETADTAISYAIQKGWLIGEGEPPHSISLRMRASRTRWHDPVPLLAVLRRSGGGRVPA